MYGAMHSLKRAAAIRESEQRLDHQIQDSAT